MTPAEIREGAHRLGLSQAQLADRLGLDVMTVSRWERGERACSMPEVLRRALRDLERELEEAQAEAEA